MVLFLNFILLVDSDTDTFKRLGFMGGVSTERVYMLCTPCQLCNSLGEVEPDSIKLTDVGETSTTQTMTVYTVNEHRSSSFRV